MGTDGTNRWWWLIALWAVVAVVGAFLYLRMRRRQEILRRVWAEDDAIEQQRIDEEEDPSEKNFVARWLYLAGFRAQAAPALFGIATVVCLAAGMTIAVIWQSSGLIASSVRAATDVPGGIGDLAAPMLIAGPWILCVFWVMAPWMVVNSERKKRVRLVEQDLPTTLDLLATMSESGLAFDSALSKVIESQKKGRPLTQELETFQLEVLSGIPRVNCFRRLSHRIEVPSVSVFVSALVQAEQVGAGFSNVLRIQADDLRNRRREDANMLAQALTVKLVFPLVICFLPGIFVVTLGPIFLQFLKLAEGVTGTR
ncbi:MAG: type II secretion system F family protein [Planctomycetes bacterium]|nr:type II secretion system F family protein [Planctomycetota bacterium]